MTDAEWAIVEPLSPPGTSAGGGSRDLRQKINVANATSDLAVVNSAAVACLRLEAARCAAQPPQRSGHHSDPHAHPVAGVRQCYCRRSSR